MRIILDVMSGDNAPLALLQGAAYAADEFPEAEITVVGNETLIQKIALENAISLDKLAIKHAESVIDMEDTPLCVVREKKNSSMSIGLEMLKNGSGDAFVSAGNTGALIAGATLIVRRIRGVQRAGIATILPFPHPVLLLDSGANLLLTPENQEQFAIMGATYMERIFGIEDARVGQLNNGTEYNKGMPLQVESFLALSRSGVNFVGNVESKEVPFNACDVLIVDGFLGNIVLKYTEGMGKFMLKTLKNLFYSSKVGMLSGAMLKKQVGVLKKQFDASEYGGAPLLGIAKPVIKAHGSSDANAVKNAVRQAISFVKTGINEDIERRLAERTVKPQ